MIELNRDRTRLPKWLFKYRPWNPNTRRLVSETEVYFQAHHRLNDPFELRCQQTIPKSRSGKNALIEDLIEYQIPSGTSREKRELRNQLRAQIQNPLGLFNADPLGVFCLSENPKNLLMWSHYGGSHAGVCVCFDSRYWPNPLPQRVQYKSELMKISWRSPIHEYVRDPSIELTLTKAVDWSYEKEWRIVRKPGVYHDHPKELIRAVLIGAKCDDETQHEIRNVAEAVDVPCFSVRLSEERYELVIDSEFYSL